MKILRALNKFLPLFLITAFTVTFLAGCDYLIRVPAFPKAPLVSEEVISDFMELERFIGNMSENQTTTLRVRLSSIEVWDELEEFYYFNPEYLMTYGIRGIAIDYANKSGYIDAAVTPNYEMYVRLIAAYETGDKSNLTNEEKQVYDRASRIVKEHAKGGTTFDKALGLHDELVSLVEYDYNHGTNPNAFNVYGALVEGIAVCQGYAQAYKLLLHMAGVDSKIVSGVAGREPHAWNLINYGGGKWAHIDATWNDTHFDDRVTHRFFNVPDEVLGRTHTWNRGLYPAATTYDYIYYRYVGKAFSSLHAFESHFASSFHGAGAYEFLCAFAVTADDLSFIRDFWEAEVTFNTDSYGRDTLLTLVFG